MTFDWFAPHAHTLSLSGLLRPAWHLNLKEPPSLFFCYFEAHNRPLTRVSSHPIQSLSHHSTNCFFFSPPTVAVRFSFSVDPHRPSSPILLSHTMWIFFEPRFSSKKRFVVSRYNGMIRSLNIGFGIRFCFVAALNWLLTFEPILFLLFFEFFLFCFWLWRIGAWTEWIAECLTWFSAVWCRIFTTRKTETRCLWFARGGTSSTRSRASTWRSRSATPRVPIGCGAVFGTSNLWSLKESRERPCSTSYLKIGVATSLPGWERSPSLSIAWNRSTFAEWLFKTRIWNFSLALAAVFSSLWSSTSALASPPMAFYISADLASSSFYLKLCLW